MNHIHIKTHCEGIMRHIPCEKRDGCMKYYEHLASEMNNAAIERHLYVNTKLCVEADYELFEGTDDEN